MHASLQKGFVILTIIFFTRVATVDMVLWEDTRIVPHDSQLWAIQCTWPGVATGTIEFATRAGKVAWTSDRCYMKRALFPHKDPCYVNCSTNYLSSK